MTQENAPPQKKKQSWVSWCIVAMQFEFNMGPNRRTLKKKIEVR